MVTGEAPVVDSTTAEDGINIRQEVAQKLASRPELFERRRHSARGESEDLSETQGRALAMTIYGATSVENSYLVDGVNTTNVIKGFQGKALSQEFVEEVQVKSSGYEAEYGRATGGVINVVTKSGGNQFHGDAFGYFDAKALTAAVQGLRKRRLQCGRHQFHQLRNGHGDRGRCDTGECPGLRRRSWRLHDEGLHLVLRSLQPGYAQSGPGSASQHRAAQRGSQPPPRLDGEHLLRQVNLPPGCGHHDRRYRLR